MSVDSPRDIVANPSTVDRAFHASVRTVGVLVLITFGSIGAFLGYESIPTLRRYGLHFFVENQWLPNVDIVGISAVMLGTVEVALVALAVAFPLALATALYVSEYSPQRIRRALVSLIDLMAAVPSIIYGAWGLLLIAPKAIFVAHWLHQTLGFIPIFSVRADANAPVWAQSRYGYSMFIAGLVVSMMVIPIAASVMREVFSQAPVGEREAALALGSTRWGMVRSVVLPFGRGGIIGGTMLGLGRALGETVAVLLIISPAYDLKIRILEIGGITAASLIANSFSESTEHQLAALLTAGFVLFLMTIIVNTIASIIVSRSRSGAATEI
jgi:phosphate transport system permease protein